MTTIRIYIANILYWISHQIHSLAFWIDPPGDIRNLTEEEKQELRDFLMK
jgi:hypothetical protein